MVCHLKKSVNFIGKKVSSFIAMFRNCHKLTSINLSNLESSPIRIDSMFENCYSLEHLEMPKLITDKIDYTLKLFENCYSLKSVNIDFTFKSVKILESMFKNCYSLTSVDLSNFKSNKLESLNSAFENCISLTSLNLSNFITDKVIDMDNVFNNCNSLTTLIVPFNTENTIRMRNMFSSCKTLTSLDISTFNTKNVKNFTDIFLNDDGLNLYVDFNKCSNLKEYIPININVHDISQK